MLLIDIVQHHDISTNTSEDIVILSYAPALGFISIKYFQTNKYFHTSKQKSCKYFATRSVISSSGDMLVADRMGINHTAIT